MSKIKNIIYNSTIARYRYLKSIYKTGVTFEEYSTYLDNIRGTGEAITKSSLFGRTIKRNNTFWFVQNIEEVFIDEVYKFKSVSDKPVILDCGSNIGLSIIYFKRLFPNAKIIGFEPDETIYEVCRENLDIFGYSDVEVINAAVWNNTGIITFLPDNSLGGKIVSSENNDKHVKKIKSVRLKDFIYDKVDFLKIDIEGAEYEVLQDCQQELLKVQNLFVEYHSQGADTQNLQKILQIVSNAGFRYYIKEAWNNMSHPFIDSTHVRSMFYDLQLNIFAYR